MILTIVGLLKKTWMKYVVLALVVILTSLGTIQYIQKGAEESLIKDMKIEQVLDEQRTTDRIDDALDEVDRDAPNPDAALEWLLRRQLGQ